MNEDDYWLDAMKRLVYGETWRKEYSWSSNMPDYLETRIYELMKETREVEDMAYTYRSYGYYDTRDGEVAKAALEALEQGLTLDQLLEKNSKVRSWWSHQLKEREAARLKAERDKERRKKAAEKKKLEDAIRAEAAAKLTPEELEAFGLNKKGYHKR